MATEERRISGRQTKSSRTFSETLAGWIRVWARLYQRPINQDDPAIFTRLLAELSPGQLDLACERVAKSFKPTANCPFPTPAHILEAVAKVEDAHDSLKAERDWDDVLEKARWYTPDLPDGGLGRVTFTDRVKYAMRSAGGIRVIAECPLEDLHFRKKDFIAAWENYSVLERDVNFLSESEVKNFFREIGDQMKELKH